MYTYAKLFRSNIGTVGQPAGLVFLVTDATESEVQVAGFLNHVQQSSDVVITSTDTIFAHYGTGISAVSVPEIAGDGTITMNIIAGNGTSGGPVENGANLGAGSQVFASKSGVDLQFRTLTAGANIGLTQSGTEISIAGIPITDYVVKVITGDYQVIASDANKLLIVNSTPNIDITLPQQSTVAGLASGFKVYIVQFQEGNARILVEGSDVLESVQARNWTEGRGAFCTAGIMDVTSGVRTWYFGGQIAGSAATGADIDAVYFSALYGSDTSGIGSITQPYATPTAAITALGTPSVSTDVRCLDGETYTDAITIAHPLINFVAPEAFFAPAANSNVFTITSSGGANYINVAGILATGSGNSIVHTGTSGIVVDAQSIIGGQVSTVNGQVFLRSAVIQADLLETGTGAIRAVSAFRSGTNTGSISSLSPAGVNSTFTIGANTFAATDSTAGYVWTTDGAGNSSLQAPSAAGDTWEMLSIPWNAWLGSTGSFQSGGDFNAGFYQPYTARTGGSAVVASSSMDFGAVTISVATGGTYNFFFPFLAQGDVAQLDVNIDSGAHIESVDMYHAATTIQENASWTYVLTPGTHTIGLSVSTKNGSSSGYNLLLQESLYVSRIA